MTVTFPSKDCMSSHRVEDGITAGGLPTSPSMFNKQIPAIWKLSSIMAQRCSFSLLSSKVSTSKALRPNLGRLNVVLTGAF